MHPGIRVTVGMVVGLLAAGENGNSLVTLDGHLEAEDGAGHAAWRCEKSIYPPKVA